MRELKARINCYSHKSESATFFSNLQIQLSGGEIVCLLGESGVGKTRLLRILLGHIDGKFDGEVSYCVDGQTFSPPKARNEGLVGLFSQDAGLLPWLDIRSNLEIPFSLNPRLPEPAEERINELLEQAKLNRSVLTKRPGQLSLGMLQRTRLIRTLMYSPQFLLLDETFTGLDPVTASEIADMVVTFVNQHTPCCLLVTHDLFNVARIASRILLLNRSRVLESVDIPTTEESLLQRMKFDTERKL